MDTEVKNIMNKKKIRENTIYRYIFSYVIIFVVLIFGFFLILKSQLEIQYYKQLSQQVKEKMNSVAMQVEEDVYALSQIDNSTSKNITLIMSRYQNEEWTKYQTLQEIEKYDAASNLIRSIIYKREGSDIVLSTQDTVRYENGIFQFYNDGTPDLTFDAYMHMNYWHNQLIFLGDGLSRYLIYLPKQGKTANYVMFYTLDIYEIQQMIKNITDDVMPAIALVTSEHKIVAGINEESVLAYLDEIECKEGIFKVNKFESLCISAEICNGYYLISLISTSSLMQQINEAFANSYFYLFVLGGLGIILVYFSMRITYLPLRKLTQKIIPTNIHGSGYIQQLERVFGEFEEQNRQLQCKLENYRVFIKKELLDSIVISTEIDNEVKSGIIDQFFESGRNNNEIFVIRLKSYKEKLAYHDFQNYMLKVLPVGSSCMVLENEANMVVFLIHYVGMERNKKEILKEILNDWNKEYGYVSAISNSGNSPMDIPYLYKNAEEASTYWNENPVSDYTLLDTVKKQIVYPYDKLNQLAKVLEINDFREAEQLLNELFEIIDMSVVGENDMSNYLIRCILIDLLITLVESMNQFKIKFKVYSDIYFEILYLCQSCLYSEKKIEIKEGIKNLLTIYQQECDSKLVNFARIQNIIELSYNDPNFSITVMAENFHVSVAYISYLVKQETHENFSDYLWRVRLEKAKELLRNSEMPIDEVAGAVGYLNASSFRRKFKQDTGYTPSQYRMLK